MNQVMLPILQIIVKLNMFLIRTRSHLMTPDEIRQCQANIRDNVTKMVKLKLS
jgi:hypothetical protein